MKKFRIAPCLTKDGVRDFAIFEDGSRKKMIQTSDKYGKYFEVDNDLNPDGRPLLKYSFTGRIKDAVETIRNGNGDVISTYNLFGEHVSVQYFIDRTIGDELRAKEHRCLMKIGNLKSLIRRKKQINLSIICYRRLLNTQRKYPML